jgi:hypothetical protein
MMDDFPMNGTPVKWHQLSTWQRQKCRDWMLRRYPAYRDLCRMREEADSRPYFVSEDA